MDIFRFQELVELKSDDVGVSTSNGYPSRTFGSSCMYMHVCLHVYVTVVSMHVHVSLCA